MCELQADRNNPVALVDLAHLSRLRWSAWGSRTATAKGNVTYCGTGCTTVKAAVTVFKLRNVCQLPVYTRLRLMTRYGTEVYNVAPTNIHC